jgi:hypothetical protein
MKRLFVLLMVLGLQFTVFQAVPPSNLRLSMTAFAMYALDSSGDSVKQFSFFDVGLNPARISNVNALDNGDFLSKLVVH